MKSAHLAVVMVEVAALRPLAKVGQASRLPGERFNARAVISICGSSDCAAAATAASEA